MEYLVLQTESFAAWRKGLRNLRVATAIRRRIERAEAGNLGDVKAIGGGVSEMRVDMGAGYRLYFTVRKMRILFLLAGGDKASQRSDIARAQALAKEV